jgi:hypothetical protein
MDSRQTATLLTFCTCSFAVKHNIKAVKSEVDKTFEFLTPAPDSTLLSRQKLNFKKITIHSLPA